MPNADDTFLDRANPHAWLLVADNLLEQAVKLYRSRQDGMISRVDAAGRRTTWLTANRSVFLLAGFALENALKAFLVFENPMWVANGKLAKAIRTHDLTRLHGMAKRVPYRNRSAHVLKGFQEGLESWARYPCALDEARSADEATLTDLLWLSYLKLMAAYGRRLQRFLEGGWTSPIGYYGRFDFKGPVMLDYVSRRGLGETARREAGSR